MFELTDRHPAVDIVESEYKRLLGYPADHPLDDRPRALAEAARAWYAEHGRPWIYARQTDDLKLSDGIVINGIQFAAQRLRAQMMAAESEGTVLVAVSAGPECEEESRRLWKEGKPDEYFFMEMFGSAVVEHLVTVAGGRICAWAEERNMAVLPHSSPGYSGWDIADQPKLWSLIRNEKVANFPGHIRVLDTGMLKPKKSLLAVFATTSRLDLLTTIKSLVPCENCSLDGCAYRRVPYHQSLLASDPAHAPPSSEAHELQRIPRQAAASVPKYSVNARALQKWSRERLRLQTLEGRLIEARFRYEGTTCSNLGCPLEFDYIVTLSPRENGHRITDLKCLPAPEDTGHTQMCEYLKDSKGLMSAIATEKPLLGRSLEDVLKWERPFSPSGCHCDAERRAHKWGLVFEVIHYALTQTEGATNNSARPAKMSLQNKETL